MRDYVFTSDWSVNFRENAKALFEDRIGKPTHYLEIGVYEGRSACWMLDNILTHSDSSYTGIDISLRENAWNNLKDHLSKITIYEGKSDIVLKHISDKFDLIYIDGNHVASAVFDDARLSWKLLNPGGIMLFDDYTVTDSNCGVATAVKIFMETLVPCSFNVLIENDQFAISKV